MRVSITALTAISILAVSMAVTSSGESSAVISDKYDWLVAQTEKSVPAYQEYLRKHPEGAYMEQANGMLRALSENEPNAWREARQTGTAAAYEAFLTIYSEGLHVAECRKALEELLEATSEIRRQAEPGRWRQAGTEDTAEAYREYLEAHPDGQHLDEAKARLKAKTAIDEAWRKTIAINTLTAYQDFLDAHPEGEHATQARSKVYELLPPALRTEEGRERALFALLGMEDYLAELNSNPKALLREDRPPFPGAKGLACVSITYNMSGGAPTGRSVKFAGWSWPPHTSEIEKMTPSDVRRACGEPSSVREDGSRLVYGRISVESKTGEAISGIEIFVVPGTP